MSEGPQVKLRTEWLDSHLRERFVTGCFTQRPDLRDFAEKVVGKQVVGAFCKGKHIFIEFETRLFLHNHLLMRGKWHRCPGRLLFHPPSVWMSLEVGDATNSNFGGQILRALNGAGVEEVFSSLGPDVLSVPYPSGEIISVLHGSELEIGVALLDQSLVSGIGNVAKSELLYSAGVHPIALCCAIDAASLARVAESIQRIVWESYNSGGRWVHRVYRRRGQKCPECAASIQMIRQGSARRTTFFCPRCQPRHAGR